MHSEAETSLFILAGGKSTRMGCDKAFVQLKGRTMLQHMLDTARRVSDDVTIVGSRAQYAAYGPVIEDLFPRCGPLAGIHAALRSSTSDLNLILAIDLPFVTPALLLFLSKQAASHPHALITVPRTSHGWQPLCAVYRREFAQVAENSLGAGRYKIDDLFDPHLTRAVTEEELQVAGFSEDLFRNINTREDLLQGGEESAK
jgi:molybdopterin-guanine dinucleotide biosynthesis protein A